MSSDFITLEDGFACAVMFSTGGYLFADDNHTGDAALMGFGLMFIMCGAIWPIMTVKKVRRIRQRLDRAISQCVRDATRIRYSRPRRTSAR